MFTLDAWWNETGADAEGADVAADAPKPIEWAMTAGLPKH